MLEELIEIHNLISEFGRAIKNEKNILKLNELNKAMYQLKYNWLEITKTDYPMLINSNNKKVNIKTVIKELKAKEKKEQKNIPKPIFTSPTLDNIINRTTNDTKLIASLDDKTFASDVPNPYRKRRKDG